MADGATHSLVGYWNPTGTVYSVSYIERDSYPQGIGRYLDAKVRTLDEVENFVNKQPNHLIHKTVDDYLKYAINLDVEYLFLYDGICWFVYDIYEYPYWDDIRETLNMFNEVN